MDIRSLLQQRSAGYQTADTLLPERSAVSVLGRCFSSIVTISAFMLRAVLGGSNFQLLAHPFWKTQIELVLLGAWIIASHPSHLPFDDPTMGPRTYSMTDRPLRQAW